MLGSFKTTIYEIKCGEKTVFQYKNKGGNVVGNMKILNYEINMKHSFLDYIRGGL